MLCLRILDEAIRAAIALELPDPRNAASMPARFDVCGELARSLFSDQTLDTNKQARCPCSKHERDKKSKKSQKMKDESTGKYKQERKTTNRGNRKCKLEEKNTWTLTGTVRAIPNLFLFNRTLLPRFFAPCLQLETLLVTLSFLYDINTSSTPNLAPRSKFVRWNT